jgi:hypothetical protein
MDNRAAARAAPAPLNFDFYLFTFMLKSYRLLFYIYNRNSANRKKRNRRVEYQKNTRWRAAQNINA